MWKTIIKESERGLLFKNGRAVRLLEPGVHSYFALRATYEVKVIDLELGYAVFTPELARVMPASLGDELVVEHDEIALVFADGRPKAFLPPGRYVLFQARAHVTALLKSTAAVLSDVPRAFWPLAPATHLHTAVVSNHERALLYVDGVFDRVLGPGAHGMYADARTIGLVRVDMREREIAVTGQEVMTRDHVTLRMNVSLKVRVVDPVQATESVQALDTALYCEAQLVVRRLIASWSVDELIASRTGAASELRAALAPRAATWGVEVIGLDLKDIVLPGEMKAILNRVVEATKQAEANNILRREETAATRSLANTAKMLEQNPMLMRLKELESYRELAKDIDQLTIVVSPSEALSSLKLQR